MWVLVATCLSLSLTLVSDSPTSLRSCASFTSNTIGVRPGFNVIGTTSSTFMYNNSKVIFSGLAFELSATYLITLSPWQCLGHWQHLGPCKHQQDGQMSRISRKRLFVQMLPPAVQRNWRQKCPIKKLFHKSLIHLQDFFQASLCESSGSQWSCGRTTYGIFWFQTLRWDARICEA